MPDYVCSFNGCGRAGYAGGYCQTHYKRKRKGLPMDAPIKAAAVPAVDLPNGDRVCKRCKVALPLSRFDLDRGAKTGRRSECKSCRGSYMRDYYADNIEDRRNYMRKRRQENGDHVRQLDNERYIRDHDKRVALAIAHSQIRRARMLGNDYEKGITLLRLRKRDGDLCCHCGALMVFKRFRSGEGVGSQATIEHLVPVSAGGAHVWSNVALACRDCNFSRGAKPLDEWRSNPETGRQVGSSVG